MLLPVVRSVSLSKRQVISLHQCGTYFRLYAHATTEMTLARAEYFSTDCEYQGVQVPLPVVLIQSGSGLSRMSINVSCGTH
ncbi:hypothetical protein ACHA69_001725 [Klebsiella aerogenes]